MTRETDGPDATRPAGPAGPAVPGTTGTPGAPRRELIVRDDGPVRWISIDRPDSKNGLTIELNRALLEALAGADAPSLRTVVLTGEGGAFSSGLDLKWAAHAVRDLEAASEHLERDFHGLIVALRRLEKPVIALVDGPAVGFGCDLALACDLRIGTPRARFGEIFVRRGLMPDGGGTYHLPRLVGIGRALELLFTGEVVEAEEAQRIGLLNRVVPVESAAAEAMAFAQRLALGPPRVHAWVKRAVYGALDGGLEDALRVEHRGQLELLQSRDFVEGVSAFFEKRPPRFTGE